MDTTLTPESHSDWLEFQDQVIIIEAVTVTDAEFDAIFEKLSAISEPDSEASGSIENCSADIEPLIAPIEIKSNGAMPVDLRRCLTKFPRGIKTYGYLVRGGSAHAEPNLPVSEIFGVFDGQFEQDAFWLPHEVNGLNKNLIWIATNELGDRFLLDLNDGKIKFWTRRELIEIAQSFGMFVDQMEEDVAKEDSA